MVSTKIFARIKQLRKDGTASIYLQVIIDCETRLYHTGNYVKPELWDGSRVKSKHKLALEINNANDRFKSKADNVILQLRNQNKQETFENFEYRFLDKNENATNDYYKFALQHIELYKKSYAPQTYKQLQTEITKLKKFRASLTFDEIDHNFMKSYELYMMNTLNNAPNTIAKTFKKIKMFVNKAYSEGAISENQIESYKIKFAKTNRTYLDMEELMVLEDMFHKNAINEHLHNTLQWFLFSCYTGLRYTDILNLNYTDISNDYILLVMGKTNDQIMIPLIDKAKKLIDQPQQSGKVFNVYTNQKCNEYLKLIMVHANINKTVSFHTARHTFATISLNLGIPVHVVSKLLGHADLKTTQIYAKLFEKTKFDQMDKWNKM